MTYTTDDLPWLRKELDRAQAQIDATPTGVRASSTSTDLAFAIMRRDEFAAAIKQLED